MNRLGAGVVVAAFGCALGCTSDEVEGGESQSGGAGGTGAASGTGGAAAVGGTGASSAAGGAAAVGGTGGAAAGAPPFTGGSSATGGSGATGVGDPPSTPACSQPDFGSCDVTSTPDRAIDFCVDGVCVSPGCGYRVCNIPAPYFPLPPLARTELTRSSDAEAVVTDGFTGLEWQGCLAGWSGADCSEGARADLTYWEAVEYCENLVWGGHEDWVLPDIHALLSLVDYTSDPPYDATALPGPYTRALWSSTSVQDAEYSVTVTFTTGGSAQEPQDFGRGVRCLRRPSAPATLPDPRFERDFSVTGEPVVTDHSTGLQWIGCSGGITGNECTDGAPVSVDYAGAETYCNDLDFGGYADWRLPNVRELVSVIAFGSNTGEFEPLNLDFAYVTHARSSTERLGYAGHWRITFHGVELDTMQDDQTLTVLCTR